MGEYIVNLEIGKKQFSLRTQSQKGEQVLRKAAEIVNENFGKRSQISGAELSDVLRMTCFDLAVEIIRLQDEQSLTNKDIDQILERISKLT